MSEHRANTRRVRLRTSKDVFATYLGPPLPLAWPRVQPLFGVQWLPETPSVLQPCRRGACLRQTTSIVSASGLNQRDDVVKERLTSCFLTGRSSSLVAASSIDGLYRQCHFECQKVRQDNLPFIRGFRICESRCWPALPFPRACVLDRRNCLTLSSSLVATTV